ncbi:MAG: hypothetical protein GXO31_09350 [Epsilonproteobacteria bacterium]|nr:hypothetical protein [Campylobacterota bacterium]
MKYIKKISDFAIVGGLGAFLVMGMSGCSDHSSENRGGGDSNAFTEASKKQGAFVVIEEVAPKQYKIVDEYPSDKTRVILRDLNGTERILSQQELDQMIAEEAKKIEAGTSNLTSPNGGGLSLGETILASAAGAILGSWIGSKLFNNPNYEQRRRTTYKTPSAYQKSVNSFKKSSASKTSKTSSFTKKSTSTRSGFFGSRSTSSTRSGSFFGG